MGAYLAAGIGGHFGSPLALLRGVLGGRVGVEVELHHSCRIVLEKYSKRFLDRNRCNRRNSFRLMSHLHLFGQSVFLDSCLLSLSASACLLDCQDWMHYVGLKVIRPMNL